MMDALWKHVAHSCLVFLFLLAAGHSTTKMKEKCGTCRDISEAFLKGIKRTDKSNFGGGNTRWEEKSLGSWRFSETRFVDIQDKLCEDASAEKKCHAMVEEHEEALEGWWFKEFKEGTEKTLYDYLCLEKIKVCCVNGTYGADCAPCPGGKDTPCSNHGDCDGIGTRGGTGRCLCHAEYAGDQCTECRESYYEKERNETYLECSDCHISCKNCSAGGEEHCIACREGYLKTDNICKDIDECAVQTSPCKDNEYCSNTIGSFVCMACDDACDRCLGGGDDKCVKCKRGYEMLEGKCTDIDECKDESLCKGDLQHCVNTPGSYRCACKKGHELIGDQCMPKQMLSNEETKKKEQKKKQRISKGLYGDAPAYAELKYFALLVLFCITGKLLKGHVPGSMMLCISMAFMFYQIGSYYG